MQAVQSSRVEKQKISQHYRGVGFWPAPFAFGIWQGKRSDIFVDQAAFHSIPQRAL